MVFYSDAFTVSYGEETFYISFEFRSAGESLFVALPPKGAKALSRALAEKISQYEEQVKKVGAWEEEKQEDPKDTKNYVT